VEKNVLILAVFGVIFAFFLQILPQLRNFCENLSMCIILILDAIFVPNLIFLGLLSPEMFFGKNSYQPTQTPSLFGPL